MPDSTQLHIVTGKGGTGKTTIAASLAMALADKGKKVLLCEVEGRQGIAQLFDVPPLPYEERKVAVGLGGGQVFALAIDPEAALLEYLQMYYKLGRAGRALDRFGIIDFATTIAPGVRDVLLTGKVYEAARRRTGKAFTYDALILDAPPTGRITRFLNVNSEVAGLAKVGPIRRQSDSIMKMMRAPETHVHLVTVLEEMPVQETLDGIAGLKSERLPVGTVVVNQVRDSPLPEGGLDRLRAHKVVLADVERSLKKAGLSDIDAEDFVLEGEAHAQRQSLQDAQRSVLVTADQPVAEVPYLTDGVDLGALFELAEILKTEVLDG
ncbi:MAG: ATPase [Nocardioidaceae bacterium]|nr:ATPase [Nocardioidaceae bacterium]